MTKRTSKGFTPASYQHMMGTVQPAHLGSQSPVPPSQNIPDSVPYNSWQNISPPSNQLDYDSMGD